MKVTPEIQEKLDEIDKDPNISTESTFLAGMEYQKSNRIPWHIISLISVFAVAYIWGFVNLFTHKEEPYIETVKEYRSNLIDATYLKRVAMMDSAMTHADNSKLYDKYRDSSNYYVAIHNYIITHK